MKYQLIYEGRVEEIPVASNDGTEFLEEIPMMTVFYPGGGHRPCVGGATAWNSTDEHGRYYFRPTHLIGPFGQINKI